MEIWPSSDRLAGGHRVDQNMVSSPSQMKEVSCDYRLDPSEASQMKEVMVEVPSEDVSEAQRRPKKMRLTSPDLDLDLEGWVEELLCRSDNLVGAEKKQSAAEEGPTASPAGSSSTLPSSISRLPPFPGGGTPSDVVEWCTECAKICKACEKDYDYNLPTLRAPKYPGSTRAAKGWASKLTVLTAARSIVSVTPIADDGSTMPQCTGFMIGRYELSGIAYSVIVTSSSVVCQVGRKLDPLPKLSVCLPDKKTIVEADLLYFSDHYDLALLRLPKEISLDMPRLGCCPDYDQEVFVLGRDSEASLGVRRGVISLTEESDYIGRNYYMFLDGRVPEGGTGGPVVDLDGKYRGMAFQLSRKPAVLSISTIMTCFNMFMRFGCIARPVHGLGLRTVASLDLDLLECIFDHDIKGGYIVDVVDDDSPALGQIREGEVIVSLNGHTKLTLPKLEDYLLSLGWECLANSVSTIDLKLVVCDLKGLTRRITMSVGLCSTSERALDG